MTEPTTPQTAVSVLLPVRDGVTTIGEQLAALATQTYGGPWELLIIDDGSSDGTLDVVTRWRDRLPQLRIVSAGGNGVAHARNVG